MSDSSLATIGHELVASEIDPDLHAIIPSNESQDLSFRSIRAIDSRALTSHGPVSLTPERRTPKGTRPMIWIHLNETKSTVTFEVILPTAQCIRVYVPFESWRLGTCESEAVRAAIQKAYTNLLRHKHDPVIVKPGMVSLKIVSNYDAQHRHSLNAAVRPIAGPSTQPVSWISRTSPPYPHASPIEILSRRSKNSVPKEPSNGGPLWDPGTQRAHSGPPPSREVYTPSQRFNGTIDRALSRAKVWRKGKRERRDQTERPLAIKKPESVSNEVGDGETGSGSGSGSGELTYSESRSSFTSSLDNWRNSRLATSPPTSVSSHSRHHCVTATTTLTAGGVSDLNESIKFNSDRHDNSPVESRVSPTTSH